MRHPVTIDYYNQNAEAFRQRTLGCNMQVRYDAFLDLLPPSAEILDAGCGPGRDSAVFLQRGCRVTATDASSAMIELATAATGGRALLLPFEKIDFQEQFDGVWASASLLHVPPKNIDNVLRRLTRSLKVGGIFYMSVKLGDGERIAADGRFFCDYTEESLNQLFARHPSLEVLDIQLSPAAVDQTDGKDWLHTTARKLGSRSGR
jgi:SAM-dependent methyltransferase